MLSDQIWLWSRGHEGGGPQAELLRRVAHWLMQEPELEENALTAQVVDGRLTIERRSTDPGPPGDVIVTDPDGKTQKLKLTETAPGRATIGQAATTPGVWQVSDGQRTAYAAAGAANPLEIADLRATATLVGKLARASGGGVHWLGSAAAPDVPELRRTEPDRAASGSSWIGLQRRHDHLVTGIAALALLPCVGRAAADAGPDGAGLAARGDVENLSRATRGRGRGALASRVRVIGSPRSQDSVPTRSPSPPPLRCSTSPATRATGVR